MLQNFFKIFFASLFLIFLSGKDGYPNSGNSSKTTIKVRHSFLLYKDANPRHDLKRMHLASLRCRIPQSPKPFCPKSFLRSDYTVPKAGTILLQKETGIYKSAGSAYILGIIYPFHFFY
ncbi:MAG TPA: hypothetical protein VGD90_12155 [Sphingobacteriaceae bacterium]